MNGSTIHHDDDEDQEINYPTETVDDEIGCSINDGISNDLPEAPLYEEINVQRQDYLNSPKKSDEETNQPKESKVKSRPKIWI